MLLVTIPFFSNGHSISSEPQARGKFPNPTRFPLFRLNPALQQINNTTSKKRLCRVNKLEFNPMMGPEGKKPGIKKVLKKREVKLLFNSGFQTYLNRKVVFVQTESSSVLVVLDRTRRTNFDEYSSFNLFIGNIHFLNMIHQLKFHNYTSLFVPAFSRDTS